VVTAKAKINVRDDHAAIVPVLLPGLDEVRAFAAKLHASGLPWAGEVFGWPAEFQPEQAVAPLDSKMTFTPADFCIGESGVWFFSLTWEHGGNAEPTEFLDDCHILASE
jgi:hypothetical protein